jgi:hypothetical protein
MHFLKRILKCVKCIFKMHFQLYGATCIFNNLATSNDVENLTVNANRDSALKEVMILICFC